MSGTKILCEFALLSAFLFTPVHGTGSGETWIRINQIGYRPSDPKFAVLVSKTPLSPKEFKVVDFLTGESVYISTDFGAFGKYGPFTATFRLDFTPVRKQGKFFIRCGDTESPVFRIGEQVYDGAADFLLKYMRQQRCGFNPFLHDSCHTHDGFTVYGPMPDGTHIDVTGGWHDAADYLQYVTTSANATFNLLLAWRDYPGVFRDLFLANGLSGPNGVPDVLDEARWGLEWLQKMHPAPGIMFNQIADDRDHAGFRLPNQDSVSYGYGLERPVYFCSGHIQGLFGYKNRTTGVASTAGKFSSAFALGAAVYKSIFPEYADRLFDQAVTAYKFGRAGPGACQTAPGRAPYFYEEDNWTDDMELASACLYRITGDSGYFNSGMQFGGLERVSPWMGADSAHHYQWYPFINIGHYELAIQATGGQREFLISCYRQGLKNVFERGTKNPFFIGIPFIWCSNNLVCAMITQGLLYRKLSGDHQFLEMETALRDWLFGCNPWGMSMVVGLPAGGVTAEDPHSSFSYLYNFPVDGGLLDGPVYGSIYSNLRYIHLTKPDEFAAFQSDLAVYHDDVGDYATNEPTMDGTASLVYYLAAMSGPGNLSGNKKWILNEGAVVRGDSGSHSLALIITGDEYADGGTQIRGILAQRKIRASFFFTGKFYRNPANSSLIRSLIEDGHYLGAHSDEHLLYNSWENRDSLLVTRDSFETDLKNNYAEMMKFSIRPGMARYFLPPFEWYNGEIAGWTKDLGLQLINHTGETLSAADYTLPGMGERYRSADDIIKSIRDRAARDPQGLNGFLLLLHIGTHPNRTDKFYQRLPELIGWLESEGYRFKRIDELLRETGGN
jgi:endoglucanase